MAVVVYDITSPESFAKAQYWVKVYRIVVDKLLLLIAFLQYGML